MFWYNGSVHWDWMSWVPDLLSVHGNVYWVMVSWECQLHTHGISWNCTNSRATCPFWMWSRNMWQAFSMSFVLLCKIGFSTIRMELWLTTYLVISLEKGMPILLKMVRIHLASKAPSASDLYSTSELDCATSSFSTRSERNLY